MSGNFKWWLNVFQQRTKRKKYLHSFLSSFLHLSETFTTATLIHRPLFLRLREIPLATSTRSQTSEFYLIFLSSYSLLWNLAHITARNNLYNTLHIYTHILFYIYGEGCVYVWLCVYMHKHTHACFRVCHSFFLYPWKTLTNAGWNYSGNRSLKLHCYKINLVDVRY